MCISCGLSYLKLDCLICGIFIVRKWITQYNSPMKTQSVAIIKFTIIIITVVTVKTRMHDT